MESPVVVDKPPEYHGSASSNNERGFPFDEEEGTGAWSELAARHPDIAVRLRQRPATWARKRRPSSQDAADDFGDSFSGFDRFPFDDIPSDFREHFPSPWNRRFGSREEPHPQPSSPQPQPQSPQQQTIATQTEEEPGPSQEEEQTSLPNYGLRNTVDLGQKSAADPSLSETEDRNQRSMSAPPDHRTANNQHASKMSGHQDQQYPPQSEFQSSNVRHIPIFVEGRDEPVINRSVDHGSHFGESKPAYVPPPPQPHVDREQYFADDVPGFHHPPNFSRSFGTPFNKGFRQGPQPFVQQKVYPQTAFARGPSPQRSQSPKPQMHPEEHFVKVPVHHEQAPPRAEPPSRPQPKQQPPQQQRQQTPPQQPPPKQQTPPPQPKPQPSANDPITLILSIQTDVLNLMTEVENFKGTKKDKKYMFLDEMLTRNLIKLDNIETDGKENIRQARKEAIKCIQKCIAVLEAKAESNVVTTPQPTQDVDMESSEEKQVADEATVENGEVEMKEATKEELKEESQETPQQEQIQVEAKPEEESVKVQEETKEEPKPVEEKIEESQPSAENIEVTQPEVADTRPVKHMTPEPEAEVKQNEEKSQEKVDNKKSPKKGTKTVKKRDKSKDKKDAKEQDSNTKENVDKNEEKQETTLVDGKGDKTDLQTMEIDGAASQ